MLKINNIHVVYNTNMNYKCSWLFYTCRLMCYPCFHESFITTCLFGPDEALADQWPILVQQHGGPHCQANHIPPLLVVLKGLLVHLFPFLLPVDTHGRILNHHQPHQLHHYVHIVFQFLQFSVFQLARTFNVGFLKQL